jgi:hypothetical protein
MSQPASWHRSGSRFVAIYRAPVLIALITIAGLLAALLGDGIWDAVSWLALSVPIAVVMWFACGCYRLGKDGHMRDSP